MNARQGTSLDKARARTTAAHRAQAEMAKEIQRAGALLFGRYYVWVENPYGKLSLRRTGLGVPGK